MGDTRYVFAVFTAALTVVGGIVLANSILDPYGITQWFSHPRINAQKPGTIGRERIYRAFEVRRVCPEVIALGNSRTAYGVPMDHPDWAQRTRRNLAMSGASIQEMQKTFELAASQGCLRQAVVGLDLFSFNENRRSYPDFSEFLFDVRAPRPALLVSQYASTAALFDTFKTLRSQGPGMFTQVFMADGSFSPAEMNARWTAMGGARQFFQFQVKNTEYFRPPTFRFDLIDPSREFRSLLESARKHQVDLRMFFSPEHAWLVEIVRLSGIWSSFEAWKRGIVRVVAEEGGTNPFPLWDFQQINDKTTEPVPAGVNTTEHMRWWSDGSHYTQEFGRLIVSRMLSNSASDELGQKLNPENVERSLRTLSLALDSYEKTHGGDIAELSKLVEAVRRR